MSKRRKIILGVLAGIVSLILITLISLAVVFRSEIGLARYLIFGQEKTFLVVFQNSLELRPTGGFIGNFAEVTTKGGRVLSYQVYNTNAFDDGKPGLEAPQPFQDVLEIETQQLRDANWSPDFPTTAQRIEELYLLEGGEKTIDGVIGITSELLPATLEVTGSVFIETLEGEPITADNVLLKIQYDTNYGFLERGTDRTNRKESLQELVRVVEQKIWRFNMGEMWQFARMLQNLAQENQIMAYFDDARAQNHITQLDFDGAIEQTNKDYFMLVDANLGALKTDYYMDREILMEITPCDQRLCHKVSVIYHNTALQASPLNNDYRSYTRVLLPEEAFIERVTNIQRAGQVDYEEEYGKKIAGFLISVPFNQKKTIQIEYTTPIYEDYELFVQKQPGIDRLPVAIKYDDWTDSRTIRTNTLFAR